MTLARAVFATGALGLALFSAGQLRVAWLVERADVSAGGITAAEEREAAERLRTAAGGTRSTEPELDLATLYLFRRRPADAAPLYERIVAREPEHADAWARLGQALRTADPGRAREAAERFRQLKPDVPFPRG